MLLPPRLLRTTARTNSPPGNHAMSTGLNFIHNKANIRRSDTEGRRGARVKRGLAAFNRPQETTNMLTGPSFNEVNIGTSDRKGWRETRGKIDCVPHSVTACSTCFFSRAKKGRCRTYRIFIFIPSPPPPPPSPTRPLLV